MRKSLDPTQTTFTSCMHDQMLESNRDDVKLEAMRCVTVMTAKGKLSVPRTLFPHIVKNVSSKNPELKKLIYLYLSNFADQEQDLALLPVASLQKSLKSPNPLVRSSALKVLTSMRLSILTAILVATLRNSVNDLSPYVRKTVAHSIIKIYRLEPTLRNEMIEYIERLFNDKNSMVLSSAVASFEVVCPDRLDLVHKHYRRFCFILADCNEWGQTLMLKLLLRYVIRTYNKIRSGKSNIEYNPSEHDPKILLRSAKPLVHSNNSAVVMAVVKLYIAISNQNEARSTITRPLIRLLYSHREIQLTVLNMIEDLTSSSSSSTEVGGENSDSDESEIGETPEERVEPNLSEAIVEKIEPTEKKSDDVEAETVLVVNKDEYEEVDGIINDTPGESQEENKKEDEVENKVGEDGGDEEDEDDEEDDDEEEEDEDDDEDEEEDSEGEDEEDEDSEEDEMVETVENNVKVKNNTDKATFDLDFIDFKGTKDPQVYKEMFRPYLKSFFIKHTDCTQVRLAKLKILTNLSSSVNVTQILRELQAYISTYVDDEEFVSAAIHTIGRCAILVKEVAHTCLNRLTSLLSNNNEHIVSNAIVVLRSQIINKKPTELLSARPEPVTGLDNNGQSLSIEKTETMSDHDGDDKINSSEEDDKIVSTVIKQVTKLLPTVTAPQARATILWILAEFCDKNLTAAECTPNVLRSIAKSFCLEDNFVKLQSLTLASKFLLSLDKEKKAELHHKVNLLTGYLFSLAKYDINHDVRDRGRFLKKLLDEEILCSKVLNGIKSDQVSNIC